MGAHFSRLRHVLSCVLRWVVCSRAGPDSDSTTTRERLPASDDIERGPRDCEGRVNGAKKPKRRALLVGISYEHSQCNEHTGMWQVLEGTHKDVKRFRHLLMETYRYAEEDIIILKDDPNLPGLSQPTRENMIRELKRLVAGAAPGDQFTFLYSGHSDQQVACNDPDEEDGMDEVMITSDLQRIIDDEINDILVKGLPVGCSLVAFLDTCHSGTLLDLPHYHCNNLYVPWLSKGQRRTKTFHNKIVRGNALDFVGLTQLSIRRSTSFCSVMTSQLLKDAPSGSPSPLRTIAEIESTSSTTDQRSATGQLLKDAYPGLPLRTSIEIESISSTYERSATSQLPKDTPSGSPSQTIAEIDSISSTYEHSATSPLLKEAPSRSPLQTVTEIDSISSMTDQRSATGQLLKDAHTGSPLRNIIEIDSISSTNRRSATSQLPKDTHSGSPLQTIAEIDCISSTYERSATSVLLEAPSGSPLQAIAEVDSISSTNQRTATSLLLKDALSGSPLRTNIEIDTISSTNQRSTSAETYRQEAHGRRCSSHEWILSPKRRFGEPDGVRCDGWCKHDLTPCATVLSLSACADPQRAWEGPRGSLTAVLCRFLERNPNPSYRTLMSHVNFQLYENCLLLHDYTRNQKKKAAQGEGTGFEGELNNFQSPQLSGLSKLNMDDILRL